MPILEAMPKSTASLTAVTTSRFQQTFSTTCRELTPPALVAGLVMEGELVSIFSHGIDNTRFPVPEHVAFRIASMTKCFAGAAMLILRDRRQLDLEQSVASILPELSAPPWDSISLLQLLTMQSGLPTDDPWGDRLLGWSNEQFSELLRHPFTFTAAPGSEYHYSNLGYMLLGAVIASVSGKSALQFITDELLQPLGMNETCWNPAHTHWVSGYTRHGDHLTEEPVTLTEYNGAVFAGIWSTISDLCRWMRFLMDIPSGTEYDRFEKVISPASRLFMQQALVAVPALPSVPEQTHYGLGVRLFSMEPYTFVGHSGGLPGYGSHFRWCRELRCGVIALGNITYAALTAPCRSLMQSLVSDTAASERTVPALLQQRASQIVSFIRNDWDDVAADQLFSSNFFLDNPPEYFRPRLARTRELLDRSSTELLILPERGLKARIVVGGQEICAFMLAPAEQGRVQQLDLLHAAA